jgi:5'-nucleotidase
MMKHLFRKTSAFIAIAALGTIAIQAAPAAIAEGYAVPTAPIVTDIVGVKGGIKVTWAKPASQNPAITNYIVSAGAGSCPVIVGGNQTSAVMPALTRDELQVSVQAVNAYGISTQGFGDVLTAAKSVAPSNIKSVQVLQFSDFHGAIEGTTSNIGAANLASAFAMDRAVVPATVTASSGDNIGASPVISGQFEEFPTIESLNAMKLDVSTMGNHEHDRNLAHFKQVVAKSAFKWVASNYDTVAPMKASATKAVATYAIVNRGGVKIGFVGANTPDTAESVFPGNLDYTAAGKTKTLAISASVTGVNKAIAAAKKAGADVVIALVHEGWNASSNGVAAGGLVDAAKKIKGAAAVFGGHSHNQYSSVINGVLAGQVKNAGVQYNRVQMCVDTKLNKVLGASLEVVNKADVPTTITPDVTAAAVVAKYKAEVAAKMDVKIGSVSELAANGGTPAVQRSGETALGSYTADAVRAKYGTQIALINGGGIRDTLPASTYKPVDSALRRTGTPLDVTLGDAYAVFPFGNSISTTTVTGEALWAALENGVSQYPSGGRWPQVSGIKFTVVTTKAIGSRITAVSLADGTAIAKDSKAYTIATIDFLVYGGDGYTQFDPAKVTVRDLLVDVLAEALRKDMAAGKTTVMKTDGRITVIK